LSRERIPTVLHGHTWTTVEKFANVAQAFEQCAFVTSKLPVILSLEMHCTPKCQNKLAKMMAQSFGSAMLTFDDLCATGRETSLSPSDLERRILTKGKVKDSTKRPSKTGESGRAPSLRRSRSEFLSTKSLLSSITRRTSPANKGLSKNESGLSHTTLSSFDDVSIRSCEPSRRDSDASITAAGEIEEAVRQLQQRERHSKKAIDQDQFYVGCLALRSLPMPVFLGTSLRKWKLPITSVNEDVLLKAIGLSEEERNQIEGLTTIQMRGSLGLTEAQLSTRAIVRLAVDPPAEVGSLQRRTSNWLLRPYPLGLRFSGKNMSPLPCWLTGAQSVCLNFSDSDLPIQLHFALFNGSAGFVLKPQAMLTTSRESSTLHDTMLMRCASCSSRCTDASATPSPRKRKYEAYFPLTGDWLRCTTITVLSLHHCPKSGEQRPRFAGSRAACHDHVPELSGSVAPPSNLDPSSPRVTLTLHPIGGFCAVSDMLPLPQNIGTEVTTATVVCNGMNAEFEEKIHCVAAEPHATFLHVGVANQGHKVAYETAVLGRLQSGYRVFALRGRLGTRIELACLFVHISSSRLPHLWASSRQLRALNMNRTTSVEAIDKAGAPHIEEIAKLREENAKFVDENTALKQEYAGLRHCSSELKGSPLGVLGASPCT